MTQFAPTIPSQTGSDDDWQAWAQQQAAAINTEADHERDGDRAPQQDRN